MLGAIIGDIIGSRFEFHNTDKLDFKLFTKQNTHTYTNKDCRVQSMLTTVWTEAGRMFLHQTIEKYRNQLGIKK